jgi:hypothetical protein
MSVWLRILNWSCQISLHSWIGFHFRLTQMGMCLRLGCLSTGLVWDTAGLIEVETQAR